MTKYAKYGVIFCYVDDGKAGSGIFQLLKKVLDILAAPVQKTEEIFSDPAFSVLPYYDAVEDFYLSKYKVEVASCDMIK